MGKVFVPSTKVLDGEKDDKGKNVDVAYQQCNKCPFLSFKEPKCKELERMNKSSGLQTLTNKDGFISVIRPSYCPKEFNNAS